MRRILLLALMSVLLAACGGSDDSNSAAPSQAELQRAMDALTSAGMPGVAVQLDGPRGPEFLTSGVADLASGRRAGPADHWRIASISKAFSVAAILSLVAEGDPTLEKTVGDYDNLRGAIPQAAAVTIRQLCNHTSGIFSYTEDSRFLEQASQNLLRVWTPVELLAFAATHPLGFPPGTAYRYSNTDNVIIGLIIEAVTGQPYSTVLQTRVFDKAGLDETVYPSTPALPDPYIHGYAADGDLFDDVSSALDPSGAGASGAIVSIPRDVGRFFTSVVRGQLYGAALLAEAMRTVPGDSDYPGPGVNNAGLGIFRYDLACGSVWGHTGHFPGYRSFAVVSADGSRTAVVWVNADPASQRLRDLTLHVQELATCRTLHR